MAIDERAAANARREAALRISGLVVLLERAGGRATFTEADYQAVTARYGGTRSLAVHVEVVRTEGQPAEVQLTLIRKEPANAELVS